MNKARIILVFIILFLIFTVYIFSNPIIGKLLTGTARIIGKESKSEIYINGKKELNAKVFISKSNFEGTQKRNYLILYLRDVTSYPGIPVLIIDKDKKVVNFSNSNEKDYNIYFNNLLQSDSGANTIIPINSNTKGFDYDPKLIIKEKTIRFRILEENQAYEITIIML